MIDASKVVERNPMQLGRKEEKKIDEEDKEIFKNAFTGLDSRIEKLKRESIAYVRQRDLHDREVEMEQKAKIEDEELESGGISNDHQELLNKPNVKKNIIIKSRRN